MNFGFVKCACVSPELIVADCFYNVKKIIECVKKLNCQAVNLAVFPELCITGYTCGDLFFQKALQNSALEGLKQIAKETSDCDVLFYVGLPVFQNECLYNCAAAVFHGKILAIIPKSFIPNYSEFYERRQFCSFKNNSENKMISLGKDFEDIPFGTKIIIYDKKNPEFSVATEICEDLWVPLSPSVNHALNGACVIVNLSASNEIIGKADYRRELVKSVSARLICAYLYCNAGNGESSQDMVFASHNLICENGTLLLENKLFSNETVISEIDVERLCQERRKITTFCDCVNENSQNSAYKKICIEFYKNRDFENFNSKNDKTEISKKEKFIRFIDSHPFVPSKTEERSERCFEVISLQAEGLAKRLRHINCSSAVIGISGGLDSTLALLVTLRAFDLCKIDRKLITCVTMPCFGTTDRTYKNACALAKECGVTLKEIKISDAVKIHFRDIGQDENIHDVTYENCQARERTQILMDIANKTGGIVIGTGDLSELALGWCTYNADHMSMYGVNSSVPKTLVRYLVEWFSIEENKKGNKNFSNVLNDILKTPVSPELLPPTDGKISQVTEDLVGPYELHDFFLYYLLRFGFSPKKIFFLAIHAGFNYENSFILKWLKTFYKRFFSQQFKRSCMPDGAKVGTINLSPRGDWRMPSDACAKVWLNELEQIEC